MGVRRLWCAQTSPGNSENGGFSMADFMHGEAIHQPQLLGYYPLVMTNIAMG